jgi:hypothetical protein
MSDSERQAKLVVCKNTLKNLISQIKKIEDDTQSSNNEKLSQIKIIKEEITKVGMEIDTLKKEVTLLSTYSIN